ncbi:MAG: type III-B CRISPR-associated protein Cas10/Cmr2, partial [Acidobacteriota bacterium]
LFWKRKLMAFLHDPPNKPLDIGEHKRIAESCLRRAGIEVEEMIEFQRECDHTAAAADRFPFPRAGRLKSAFSGSREDNTPFLHPLGGSGLYFDRPLPSAEFAEEIFQLCQPGGNEVEQLEEEQRAWARFFLHWRLWPSNAAEKDYRTLFLPADTRLPDHNVWTHNSVVSALQGCVAAGRLEPAFLLFQLAPVQEFIQQARSTRDLWSGSYLLSWLMGHAIQAVTDEVGPDSVIFPALRGLPLFDLLHRERLYAQIQYPSGEGKEETLWQRLGMPLREEEILTPNLPNRFLALVPAERSEQLAAAAQEAVGQELRLISRCCRKWLAEQGEPVKEEWRRRFEAQVEAFPKVTWHVYPWSNRPIEETLDAFHALAPPQVPAEETSLREFTAAANLAAVHRIAVDKIPREERDGRYFEDREECRSLNNRGFCWSYYYALTDWLLAARRRTRDFQFWDTDDHQEGAVKDSFSGLEEVVGDEGYWEALPESPSLGYLFRSQDRLGAMNLIKRVWHKAYLEAHRNLRVDRAVRFESVPGVAAGQWRERAIAQARQDPETWHALLGVRSMLIAHSAEAATLNFTVPVEVGEKEWLERTDPGCLVPEVWLRASEIDPESGRQVAYRLQRFYKESGIRKPPTYYAVVAFDGDRMGKWLSGEMTPPLFEQFSRGAQQYFQPLMELGERKELRRPLSPSYHLAFSEALANFGLYLVRPIVEHFGGQLIYSGGDDVLAMLPAATALDCAETLWLAFRGDPRLAEVTEGRLEVLGEKGGFVRLCQPAKGLPSWPLAVPGRRAQASAGVVIGHIHSPLQGLVRAARDAEKRAKKEPSDGGLGRAACAVSLFKRSGEILHWGFKWRSRALALYRRFCQVSQNVNQGAPALSGRFGYALREFLTPYAPATQGEAPVLRAAADFDPKKAIIIELRHVLSRQGERMTSTERNVFERLCREWLEELQREGRPLLDDFPRLFDVGNFVQRGE